jgi:cbb3-type cytochrome oxidase subunit 3
MGSEGLSHFTGIPLTVFGMMLFVLTFCAVVAWLYLRRSAREEYDKIAQLPFEETEAHGG